jgi:RND family efflux transporter MFP subunit
LAANRGFKTNLDTAQFAYDRGRELSRSGNLSDSALETRQSAFEAAKASLEQGEAALKALEVQLSQATIVSPVDGRLAAASPAVGQLAQAGMTLFSVIENDALEVQAKVPEQLLGKVAESQTVQVVASDGSRSVGRVRAIAQQVDAATRLGIVYVTLPNSTGFRVGMSARTTFETPLADVVTVPDTALAFREGATGVFTVDQQETVHFLKIEIGDRHDGRVIVLSGLASGQRVAVDGVGFLDDGMQVRVAGAAQDGASK